MKTFLAWVGAIVLVVHFFGAINALDVHVCIKGPGECGPHDQGANSVVENGAQIEAKTSEPRADTGFDGGGQSK
jgi:hypothetical protein